MEPFAEIRYSLEISDHDGYCSDAECEYTCQNLTEIVPIHKLPKDLQELNGRIRNFDFPNFNWYAILPEPNINYSGSNYCENYTEDAEIDRHSYRITILSVTIKNNEILLVKPCRD